VDLFDLGGSYFGYSKVNESVNSLGGKVSYYFTNYDSHPDVTDANYIKTDMSFKRGQLISTKVFDELNNPISEEIIEYDFNLSDKKVTNGTATISHAFSCSCGFLCSTSGNSTYTIKYSNISRPITTSKVTNITFAPFPNSSKNLTQIVEYQYDPTTVQLKKAIQYDNSRPTTKFITETRYVTDPAYTFVATDCNGALQTCLNGCNTASCESACYQQYSICNSANSPSPEVQAMAILKERHQVAVPIEILNLMEENATAKVLAAQYFYYLNNPSNANMVNLKETWAMAQPIDQSSYLYSKKNEDGSFTKDSRLIKRQTFNQYNPTTGNLLQQTGFNGIQTNYTWDASNNFVSSVSSTGGVNTRTTSTTIKPLVGPLTSTDANGVVMKNEYDVYNRLHLVKDGSDNILKMYRYHYAGEKPGFALTSSTTKTIVNRSVTFTIQDVAQSVGGAGQFVLDYGDGVVVNNPAATTSHTYTSAGYYFVKLTLTNPEYGSTFRTLTIDVNTPVSLTLCRSGIITGDLCGIDTPATGTCSGGGGGGGGDPEAMAATTAALPAPGGVGSSTIYAYPASGCSPYSYNWEYKLSSSSTWFSFGTGSSVTFNFSNTLGTYEIRCTVSDSCNTTATATTTVTYYESSPGCPHN
jgi:PKD repeat protein